MNTSIHSNTFFALDFDRCLGDTERLYYLFIQVAEEMGLVKEGELEGTRKQVEESGGSFDILTHLADVLTAKQLNELSAKYLEYPAENDEFLGDGARELLDWLEKNQIDYGIVTYGGTLWQALKIKRAGLGQMAHYMIDHPEKARLIVDWYDEFNKGYYLPAVLASRRQYQEIVLVDDKAKAFTTLDKAPGARGYWVCDPNGSIAVSQEGSVPENVRTVTSLRDIVNYEQNILT